MIIDSPERLLVGGWGQKTKMETPDKLKWVGAEMVHMEMAMSKGW